MMALRSLDVFCGAGGLTHGLSQAGIECRMGIDADRDCAITFSQAHNSTGQHYSLDGHDGLDMWRGEVDLVVGGPPCQPFSVHGKQRADTDARDGIPFFLQAIGTVRPKAFLMENVANLAAPRHTAYFYNLLDILHAMDYRCDWRVLDAADYGVPQNRNRLFVMGVQGRYAPRGTRFEWPSPTHRNPVMLGPAHPGILRPWVTVREALRDVPECEPNTSKVVYAKNPVLRPRLINSLIVNGKGRVLNLGKPSPTVTAESAGNGGHILDIGRTLGAYHEYLLECDGAGIEPILRSGEAAQARRITWREAARLQGFPDDYPFWGTTSSRYRQIGNAVPPPLARAVGDSIVRYLEVHDAAASR